MSTEAQQPQYQPTPELQKILDQLTPNVLAATKLPSQALKLKSFSRGKKDPDQFTFFVETTQGPQKLYKLKIKQTVSGDKASIQILGISELVTK